MINNSTGNYRVIYSSNEQYYEPLDYTIGDMVVSKDNPINEIGRCTGFTNDDTCILIDGKNWGGKYYFMKSQWAEFEVLD